MFSEGIYMVNGATDAHGNKHVSRMWLGLFHAQNKLIGVYALFFKRLDLYIDTDVCSLTCSDLCRPSSPHARECPYTR